MTGFTLLYHRVALETKDWGSLCVSPKNFEAQLAVLDKYASRSDAYGVITQAGPRKKFYAHITFDDGYKDNLDVALPVIEKWGWPATVFVTTGRQFVNGNFWWITLEHVCRELNFSGHGLRFATGANEWHIDYSRSSVPEKARHAYLSLGTFLRGSDLQTQERLINWLLSLSVDPQCANTSNVVLAAEEIERLAASRYITIGAHTVNHLKLSLLSDSAIAEEMAESKAILERITKRKIDLIAYPFGRREDIGASVFRAAKETGFDAGFVNWAEPFFFAGSTYARRRLLVRDWPGEEFEARLVQYMRFGVWRWQ